MSGAFPANAHQGGVAGSIGPDATDLSQRRAEERGLRVVRAPAKVNLYLHVVGRRPDGYHLLDSLVVFADCGDRIAVTPRVGGLEFSVHGPFAADVPTDGDNLALRAAQALLAEVGGRAAMAEDAALGASIRLEKNLPVASGVGGGSADAAATLHALADLWQLSIAEETLARLALALGADVPMCLDGRPAHISGIGEEIEPVANLPLCALVLANPGVAVPTPDVFRRRQGPFSPAAPRPMLAGAGDATTLAAALRQCSNDLTDAAIQVAPVVAEVLAALESTPGVLLARMSGSGATCFGLVADPGSAMIAAAILASRHPHWWVAAAPLAAAEP